MTARGPRDDYLAGSRARFYHTEPWDLDREWSWEWLGEYARWALRPGALKAALWRLAASAAALALAWAACAVVWTGVGL